MNLRELCFHLRNRRRMYLLDDRFGTAVAFVDGYNCALDGVPLSGFQEYVAARTGFPGSGVHWSYLIAAASMPEIFDKGVGLGQVPLELGIPLTDRLVDLLEAYQAHAASGEGAGAT